MGKVFRKVLVADANGSFVAYAAALLRKMGFLRTMVADSPAEALSLMRLWPPDIAILSAEMPGMAGSDMLGAMRADPETRDIPVIMVTDKAIGHTLTMCREHGCYRVLKRPVRPSTLNEAIQDCISESGGNRRVHLRAGYRADVLVTHGKTSLTLKASALSEGGIFLRTEQPMPIGWKLRVRVPIDERTYTLKGEIIYHKGSGSKEIGMAVRFIEPGPRASKAITKHILALLSSRQVKSSI